jgi:hypothetical protein
MTDFLAIHDSIQVPLERILQCVELLATLGNRLRWMQFRAELEARAEVPDEVGRADDAADAASMLTKSTVSSTGAVANFRAAHGVTVAQPLAAIERRALDVAGEVGEDDRHPNVAAVDEHETEFVAEGGMGAEANQDDETSGVN